MTKRAGLSSHRGWQLLRGPAGLFAFATLLTLAMAAAVLPAPGERLFGCEIVGRHSAPFIVLTQFERPAQPGLYTQPVTDYPGAALARVLGDGVAAFNAVVLTSFPLAALFAFLLARRLTGSVTAAWVAGLAYGFAPHHVAHAAYHAHIAQTQWLPLYLLALWLCLERATVPRLLLLAAGAALVALSNFYNGLIAALLTPLALLVFWSSLRDDTTGGGRQLARTAAALGLAAAAGAGWILTFAPRVLSEPHGLAFPRQDLFAYSARWWSYLLPPVEHPLAGGWVKRIWERHPGAGLLEQQVTIGVGLCLLAAIAVLAWWRRRPERLLRSVPALAALAGGAFLFSLSPELELGPISLPRPSGLVYPLLPMFRAYARFGLVVMLAVATLAGIGAALLWRRRRPATRLAAGALLALAAVELAPFPPWRARDVLPTTAHRWLSGQPPPLRVRDCVPRHSHAGYLVERFFAHRIDLLEPQQDCADPGFTAALAAADTTHLLVRRDSALGRWLTGRPALPGTLLERRFDDALLYTIVAEPPALARAFTGGFHWREYKGPRSYRWMRRRGTLAITNRTAAPVETTLELTLHAFPATRTVTPKVDGLALAPLRVSTEPRAYTLGPLVLAPGRHLLELETATPAVVADELLGNGDRRELALALWEWRLRER